MRRPWIIDRGDPRTILLVSLAVLGFGIYLAPDYLQEGGALKIYMVAWLVLSALQMVWAAHRVWKMRRAGNGDASAPSLG